MQNVGAAALFLPVVKRISLRSKISMSRLLMPMGFCAILGGTLTMVGSSPLILLNDLIILANDTLPADQQVDTFGLFDVTPIGIALVLSGILYFVVFGPLVLPKGQDLPDQKDGLETHLLNDYGIDYIIAEIYVPSGSRLVGNVLDSYETLFHVRTVGVTSDKKVRTTTRGVPASLVVAAGDHLAVIGERECIEVFCKAYKLSLKPDLNLFSEVMSNSSAGLAEVVVPPTSKLIGESARTLRLREVHGVSTLSIIRNGKTIREGEKVRSEVFQAGDTVVVFADWQSLQQFHSNQNVVITSHYPQEEVRPHKVLHALTFFGIAMALVLLTDLRLSVALMVGALGIIISGVLDPEEAYASVSWKTVFLLASLIPMGKAMETSGTAEWIADRVLYVVGDVEIWVLQLVLAMMATVFTLVMSNVGATVLLVPLAISIALHAGANPAVFALTVAIATSNSFLLPTHQVNALIMGPGRYKVPDFLRAGGIMTVIFLVVLMVMMQIMY